MIYSTYLAAYFIIGFVICVSYLTYKTLTLKDDDYFVGFFALALFYFWPLVIPIALFVWLQKKFKV